MRTIGLLGGMSYLSTGDYYTRVNGAVAAALGGHNSAPILLDSLNFADVHAFQKAGDWVGAGRLLADHARRLAAAGAQAVAICTNLMHKVAPAVEDAIDVPLLHIVDAVADDARARGLRSLGIMGARWTMTEDFYASRLSARGVEPVKAEPADVATTDRIVFDELTQGVIRDQSRAELLGVVERLVAAGADGVLLGCTELPLILTPDNCPHPIIDSTHAHVAAIARFVLS
ncbi:MAG: amino acid racemase [Propionibacteriaceae bacterium]|jgi:aspartate racemase|nr:amino acid racemase [Propionibacteriaceae bacterium]